MYEGNNNEDMIPQIIDSCPVNNICVVAFICRFRSRLVRISPRA